VWIQTGNHGETHRRWTPGVRPPRGELSTQSEEFRTRSAAHNVRLHQTGAKHVHHPVVGDLSLTFEMLELRADPGLTILTYTAEPGSKSEEALDLLASWTATLDQAEPAHVTDEA
jgi:MmyB-like transcription regulator ligand binding domain